MSTRKDNWKGMNWIRQEKRLAIYMRDGLACAYCGSAVEDGAQMSLDHIIPHSQGGSNDATNLITCCSKCNSSRGNRPAGEFADAVAGYLNHGITGADIRNHIANCLQRPLETKEAKAMIARRGSAAKVLANR